MQSMQKEFSQDFQSVESPAQDYHAPMNTFGDAQGTEKSLPNLRLYRSPNHKQIVAKQIGSLFDGGIDVREERRRKEEKLWGDHHRAVKPVTMTDVDNAMDSAFAAPKPLAMNSQTSGNIEVVPKPLPMADTDDAASFAAPTPLAMNTQASSRAGSFSSPTPLKMNTQDSSNIEDPAVNADGMLSEMRAEVSSVSTMVSDPPPPPMRHEGGWDNAGETRQRGGWGNAGETRRPRGRDPIMSKLADVQRKLLALHHKGNPKVEMKPSPLIPDDDSAVPMSAPQPRAVPVARHHNRLWDTNFQRPPVQPPAKVPGDMVFPTIIPLTLAVKAPEASPPARVSAPPKKKFAKASRKARKPPVKALLSHNNVINQDASTSLNAVFSGKIEIPPLPSVKESRAAIESQEAKKEVASEEAEVTPAATAPTPVQVSSPAATAAKEPNSPQPPQAAEKAVSDDDEDSGVGTLDSDEEDDKNLANLEKQVDDFEAQQHQAMVDDTDATDSS